MKWHDLALVNGLEFSIKHYLLRKQYSNSLESPPRETQVLEQCETDGGYLIQGCEVDHARGFD